MELPSLLRFSHELCKTSNFYSNVNNVNITYLCKERSHYDSLCIIDTGQCGVQLVNHFRDLLGNSFT